MYRIRVWSGVRVQASKDLSLPSSSSPATILPAFPFCLSNWFKRSLRASRDRSSVKGGANSFPLRTRRRGASNTELGNRIVQNPLPQNTNQPWQKANYRIPRNNSHDACNDAGLKSCSRSPNGDPKDVSPTLCVALQSCGCHGRSH